MSKLVMTFGIYGHMTEEAAADSSESLPLFDIAWKGSGAELELIGAFRPREGVALAWQEDVADNGEKIMLLSVDSDSHGAPVSVSFVFNARMVMDGQADEYVERLWSSWNG